MPADSDRLTLIEHDLRDMRNSMSLLVALNERVASALDRIAGLHRSVDDHEGRIRALEIQQPGLREARSWVLSGASAIISAVLTAAVLSFVSPNKSPSVPQRPAFEAKRPGAETQ